MFLPLSHVPTPSPTSDLALVWPSSEADQFSDPSDDWASQHWARNNSFRPDQQVAVLPHDSKSTAKEKEVRNTPFSMILDQLEPTVKPHPQSTPSNSLTQLCIQVLILWLLVHTGKAACSTFPPVPCGLGLEEWGNDHASFLASLPASVLGSCRKEQSLTFLHLCWIYLHSHELGKFLAHLLKLNKATISSSPSHVLRI